MSMTVTVPSLLFDTYANLPFGAIAIPVGLTPTLTVGPAGRPVPVEIETTPILPSKITDPRDPKDVKQ